MKRKSQDSDVPFFREMLYEAVFWRTSDNRPSVEEGLAYPEVSKSLADWGERGGDTTVVAIVNSIPVGTACYRFWNDSNFDRGYVDENTPVLVIGVHRDYRQQGFLEYADKGDILIIGAQIVIITSRSRKIKNPRILYL